MQLTTKAMLRAKKTTGHRDFEVVRELQAAVVEGDLGRVLSALAFGLEHLGSAAAEGASALATLLQGESTRTLMHAAAARGHADIVHAFLEHGATSNAQVDTCRCTHGCRAAALPPT